MKFRAEIIVGHSLDYACGQVFELRGKAMDFKFANEFRPSRMFKESLQTLLGKKLTATPTGSPRKACFVHFWDLAAKWFQEAPRRLVLTIFKPWPPNAPRKPPEGSF